MSDQIEPKLTKWPFYLGDALLLGTAWGIYSRTQAAMGAWEMGLAVACIAGAALFGVAPFLLEFRALTRLSEVSALQTAIAQIQKLETLAGQISGATDQWHSVHERAEQTAENSRKIAERMGAEVKAFTQFLEQANNTEKANLRLEVEKLRRAEADWLQVLVRMLDHVHALHQGAVRSGQANLIEQLGRFQHACCDIARRVGLTPFSAAPSEPLDPQRHQVLDGEGEPAKEGLVSETVAAGYTYQGQLLRPALVRLHANGHPEPDSWPSQNQLEFGTEPAPPPEPTAGAPEPV